MKAGTNDDRIAVFYTETVPCSLNKILKQCEKAISERIT